MTGRLTAGGRVAPGGWPLAAAGVAVAGAAPWLLDPYSLSQAARMLAIGLLAVSVAVLTGHAGLPSLGQVAPYAVGGYTTGLLAKAGHTVGPVQLAVAAAVAAGFSTLVGLAVIRTRGVTFLMISIAVGVLAATAAEQWELTGGSDGLYGIPATRPWPGAGPMLDQRHLYWYVLVVVVIAVAVTVAVLRSPAGMLLRGCRDNETRMRASGHRVNAYLLAAYVAAGALAGVGGSLLVSVQRFIAPSDVGFHAAALVLLAVIIGGAASVWGALAGAALVVSVRDWAAAGVPGNGPLVLGALFIVAVFALPHGIAGAAAGTARQMAALRRRLRRDLLEVAP